MGLSEDITITIAFTLLGVVCIAANGLVCYLIGTQRRLKNAFKYYVLSLAATDIMVGIALIPTYLLFRWVKSTDNTNVRLQNTLKACLISLEILNAVCSISHLCLIALDRVIAVTAPVFYRLRMRKKGTVLRLLLLPWLLSLLLALLPHVLKQRLYFIVLEIIVFSSNIFIIVCYSILLRKIRKHPLFRNTVLTKETKMIKTLFAIMIMFTVCWMPSIILLILYITKTPYPRAIGIPVKLFQYFNSICNPFIYAIFNPALRADARKLVANLCSNKCRSGYKAPILYAETTKEEAIATQL